MRRRDFFHLLGSTAVAWPYEARAQRPPMPVVGFLSLTAVTAWPDLLAAFRQGLAEAGFVEGQNVAIEYRWAENDKDRLLAMAVDLVGRQVAVIVATGGSSAIRAAMQATGTIPIVFTSGADPVAQSFIASLSRPGGNTLNTSLSLSTLTTSGCHGRASPATHHSPRSQCYLGHFNCLSNWKGQGPAMGQWAGVMVGRRHRIRNAAEDDIGVFGITHAGRRNRS